LAAKYGRVDAARLLVRNYRADIDVTGKNRLTALHVAAYYDNVDVALLLLQHAANTRAVAQVRLGRVSK